MRVTRSEEYGVRLAIRLALERGQLTIRELSEREGISEPTVAKVISRLRRSGAVAAERGRHGGYSLALAPEDITVARILDAMDDHVYDSSFCDRMSPGLEACTHLSTCTLKPVWRELESLMGAFLDGITVADLIAGRRSGSGPRLPVATDSVADRERTGSGPARTTGGHE